MLMRVVWGLGDVMESFRPKREFNRVDLPTLGKPAMATLPQRKGISNAISPYDEY
jgi:hypothetical protein